MIKNIIDYEKNCDQVISFIHTEMSLITRAYCIFLIKGIKEVNYFTSMIIAETKVAIQDDLYAPGEWKFGADGYFGNIEYSIKNIKEFLNNILTCPIVKIELIEKLQIETFEDEV